MANLVKYLSEKEHIDTELAERLTAFIEARHKLIHRWTVDHGLIEQMDSKESAALARHAMWVEQEARHLAQVLAKYVFEHTEPEWASANLQEYRERMQEIFKLKLPDDPELLRKAKEALERTKSR